MTPYVSRLRGCGPRYAIAVDHARKGLQVDGFRDVVVHSGAESSLSPCMAWAVMQHPTDRGIQTIFGPELAEPVALGQTDAG